MMTTSISKPKNKDPRLKSFVQTYRELHTPKDAITVKDWMKKQNHEIWRKCKNCGNEEDLRKDTFCTVCGADLLKQ